MNDILARRARRATVGIALSAALVAGIAPATAIAAEISSPTDAVALQTAAANSSETAATEKDKAYAAMQEALKNLEAAKDAASPEKIAEIDTKIAIFQKNYDTNLARAAIYKESLPTMQADIDAAQSECDKAHNRTRDLEAELNKIPTRITKLDGSWNWRSWMHKSKNLVVKISLSTAECASKVRKA